VYADATTSTGPTGQLRRHCREEYPKEPIALVLQTPHPITEGIIHLNTIIQYYTLEKIKARYVVKAL
jgi:hypothetical protein